jgi:ketosteroid isomerase-like protein
VEKARRDAGVTTAVDQVHELNEAVAAKDFARFTDGMHPDAVWEHNPGSGSPEEGEYQGRDRIKRLFERVYEGREYMRPVPTDIRELEDGVFVIHGELRCKHTATQNVIVEHYEQRLEIRDGLMAKGRMVIGPSTRG